MKTSIVVVMIVLAMLLVRVSLVAASGRMSIVDLGPGYVHEDGRLDLDDVWIMTAGQPSFVIGHVQAFLGPLDHLDASDPSVEFTWITTDQVSAGGVLGHGEDCAVWSLDFKGGRFYLLRDSTPDADISDPSTFADGEVILEAQFLEPTNASPWNPFSLNASDCPSSGRSAWFNLAFDGGTYLLDLNPNNIDLCAGAEGTYQIGDELPQSLLELDYFAQVQMTLTIEERVPVTPTTWGRIKAKYGN